MPIQTGWFDRLTIGELMALFDATNHEVARCESEMMPARHLTDLENTFRIDEAREQWQTAIHAREMVVAKLRVAGVMLFKLATGTELPAMIREAVRDLAQGELKAWMRHAERDAKRLHETCEKLRAACSYYQTRLEDLRGQDVK